MLRSKFLSTALVTALGCWSCGSIEPLPPELEPQAMYLVNSARTNSGSGNGPTELIELNVLQEYPSFNSERPYWSVQSLLKDPSGAVIIAADGLLYAISASTGQEIWRLELSSYAFENPEEDSESLLVVCDKPTIVDGIAYLIVGKKDRSNLGWPTTDLTLRAVDISTQQELWNTRVDGFNSGSILVTDDVMYASLGREIHAFSKTDGQRIWITQGRSLFTTPPAFIDGIIYIGDSSGTVHAINSLSGEHIWIRPIDTARLLALSVFNDVVYTGGPRGTIFAINAKSGQTIWNFPTTDANFHTPFIIDEGILYASANRDSQEIIYAVNLIDSTLRWRYSTVAMTDIYTRAFRLNYFESRVHFTVSNGIIYTSDQRHLYAIDANTGQELSKLSLLEYEVGNVYQDSDEQIASYYRLLSLPFVASEGRLFLTASRIQVRSTTYQRDGARRLYERREDGSRIGIWQTQESQPVLLVVD